jgi:hypothetical protein
MKTVATLLLLVYAIGPVANGDESEAHPLEAPVSQATAMLSQRQDPDSLAAAAMLTLLKDRAGAEQLVARARASAAGAKRADLLWLHAQLCAGAPACDRKALDAQLRALDPDNGVTLIGALAEDATADDPAGRDRQLDALAASKRVDLYWNPLIAHLASAVVSTKTLSVTQSLTTVIGVLAATTIPGFHGITALCRRDELERDGRRARCQAVARALQRTDTALVEMVGVGMTRQLWPESSAEARAAREARRVFDYRTSLMTQESERLLADDDHAAQYLEKLGQYRREQDVIVAQLVAAGRNPTPPASWQAAPPPGGTPGPAAR